MSDLLNNILVQTAQNKSGQPMPLSAFKLDMNSQTKIQPLNPRGRMLKSHIIGSPIEYVKDLGKDIVSIKNGTHGKANDHELGRMNDLAMKTGSLALATYLFAKNPLKLKRTMEFVGFGTFFASMALWPKLAIQAPLKARTGVDIHQKYQDSYGRKKMFFQDPQYIPWDLVSKEELNKMGDKLNIPKDIKNRDEVIKQKAQKLAIQGNTLWMLTAGFATPLMSALSCNLAERGILNLQEKRALDKTAKMMENPSDFASGFKNSQGKKALEKFLEANSGQALTEDMSKEIAKAMKLGSDLDIEDAVAKDLLANAQQLPQPINDDFVQKLFSKSAEVFPSHQVNPEDLKAYIASQGENFTIDEKNMDSFADSFTEFMIKNKSVLTEEKAKQIDLIIDSISKTEGAAAQLLKDGVVDKKAIQLLVNNNKKAFASNNISCNSILNYVNKIKEQGENFTIDKEHLKEIFETNKTVSVNEKAIVRSEVVKMVGPLVEKHNLPTVGSISKTANTMFGMIDEMTSKKAVIDKFVHVRVGDQSETFIANQWSRVNKEFMKAIGITNKELDLLKDGGKVFEKGGTETIDLIAKKLTELAKDKTKYEIAMKKISIAISKYDDVVSKEFTSKVKSSADTLFSNSGAEFIGHELKFNNISKALVGSEISDALAKFDSATLKTFMKNYIPASLEEVLKSDESIPQQLKGVLSSDSSIPKKLEEILKSDISEPLKLKCIFGFDMSGSLKNGIKLHTDDRILGARASFYRMIQSMDLFKRIESGAIDKPLKSLGNIDFDALNLKRAITPKDLLSFIKGGYLDLGVQGYDNLQAQFEKNFGAKCEVKESLEAYDKLLNEVHPGKAKYLREQIQKLSLDKMTALVQKEMKDVGDSDLEKQIIESWKKHSDQLSVWKPLGTMLETIQDAPAMRKNLSKTTINELNTFLSTEIIDKCKKTLLNYQITDHTEKLNDVGPKTYKTIMELLFSKDFDSVTKKSMSTSLFNNINEYRKDFMDKIVNWQSWYKPAHGINVIPDYADKHTLDSMKRHLLVGSSVEDMIKQTASSSFNTNKWLKMFGVGFAALVGVTLTSGLFFGKMKKEEVYAGDKK